MKKATKTPDINAILQLPANKGCSRYGAQMGRRSPIGEPAALYLQRIQFEDGAYDKGGAYWGAPANLWCAFDASPDGYNETPCTMIFVRAADRKEAKKLVLREIDKRTGDPASWSFVRQ